MEKDTRFVGLDVHAATIAVAVAEADGSVCALGTIPNQADAVGKLVKKLGPAERLHACYEAGPCGYALYWQLTGLGVGCEVVAPTLIPVRPGDRVKTDRRDAEHLARCLRSGDLTAVWVPNAEHEALRDLVRARGAAKGDQTRARNRLGKFLLRQNRRPPKEVRAWSKAYSNWLCTLTFQLSAHTATFQDYLNEVEHLGQRLVRLEAAINDAVATAPPAMRDLVAALQALRGVAKVTAVTVVAELGSLCRFEHPQDLMGYSGLVSREHSSGPRTQRGRITKTGNAHLRRVLVEAAHAYRHRAVISKEMRRRQADLAPKVTEIAWKAQVRLCKRYHYLVDKGKHSSEALVAVARELLGFMWAIGIEVELPAAA
jgi:transposase